MAPAVAYKCRDKLFAAYSRECEDARKIHPELRNSWDMGNVGSCIYLAQLRLSKPSDEELLARTLAYLS